jgi:hypothetical protein
MSMLENPKMTRSGLQYDWTSACHEATEFISMERVPTVVTGSQHPCI